MLELSVVMPVYNEKDCVGEVLSDWLGVLRELGASFRILVVDDGSTDGTDKVLAGVAEVEQEVKVLRQENAGHGAAVLLGYRAAESEWVFQTDSDGELAAEEFVRLWSLREGLDGVRGLRPAKAGAAYRSMLRLLEPLAVALLFGRWHRDLNVPFRLYRKEALDRMLARLPKAPFAPNALLTALGPACGLDVRVVDIRYAGRIAGCSTLNVVALGRACLRVLRDLLVLRFSR